MSSRFLRTSATTNEASGTLRRATAILSAALSTPTTRLAARTSRAQASPMSHPSSTAYSPRGCVRAARRYARVVAHTTNPSRSGTTSSGRTQNVEPSPYRTRQRSPARSTTEARAKGRGPLRPPDLRTNTSSPGAIAAVAGGKACIIRWMLTPPVVVGTATCVGPGGAVCCGRECSRLRLNSVAVCCAASGRWVAVATPDELVLTDFSVTHTLQKKALCLAFQDDRLDAGANGKLLCWRVLQEDLELDEFKCEADGDDAAPVAACARAPGGGRVAAAGEAVWLFPGSTVLEHDTWVCAVAWKDGDCLCACDLTGAVSVWDGRATTIIANLANPAIAISLRGAVLVAVTQDGVHVLEGGGATLVVSAWIPARAATISWDGDTPTVLAADRDHRLLAWRAEGRGSVSALFFSGCSTGIGLVAVAGGTDVAVADAARLAVRVWRLREQQHGVTLLGPAITGDTTGPRCRPVYFEAIACCRRDDATLLATADNEGSVALWELYDTPTLLRVWRYHAGIPVRALEFAGEDLVLSLDVLGVARLVRWRTGELVEHLDKLAPTHVPWAYARLEKDLWCLVGADSKGLVAWDPHGQRLLNLKAFVRCVVRDVVVDVVHKKKLRLTVATDDAIFVVRPPKEELTIRLDQPNRGIAATASCAVHSILAWIDDEIFLWQHHNHQDNNIAYSLTATLRVAGSPRIARGLITQDSIAAITTHGWLVKKPLAAPALSRAECSTWQTPRRQTPRSL